MKMFRWKSPQALMEAARRAQVPNEKQASPKRQTRYDYTRGPMYFLGQQIVKGMQDAGYPSKIHEHYRTRERQYDLFRRGRSKAPPGLSPHQWGAAVDIVHQTKGWEVSRDYWDTLNAVVQVVAKKYEVRLRHGHDWDGDGVPVPEDPTETFWDAAHIELADWRWMKEWITAQQLRGDRPRTEDGFIPTEQDYADHFWHVLPDVVKGLYVQGRRLPAHPKHVTFTKWVDELRKKRKRRG